MKKEFLRPKPEPPTFQLTNRRCQKFYLLARKAGKRQMEINRTIEGNYHSVIKAVKKLYATLPNETDRTVFEMNRKGDSTSVSGMHDFLTTSFYWNLECDIWGKYSVCYAFGSCPFRKQIEELIDDSHLRSYIQVKDIPNLSAYYKEVIGCQPKELISVLKAEEL